MQGRTGVRGYRGFPRWADGPTGRAMRKRKRKGKKNLSQRPTALLSARGLGGSYCCDRLYLCVHVSLPLLIANQMSSMWVSPTHFLSLLQLSLVNHAALTNGATARQLWWRSKRSPGRWSIKNGKVELKSSGIIKRNSLQELAATSRKITDLFGGISGPPTGPIPSTSSSSGELQQRQLDFTKPESSSSKDDEPDADTAEHGAEPSQGTTSDMMMVSYV